MRKDTRLSPFYCTASDGKLGVAWERGYFDHRSPHYVFKYQCYLVWKLDYPVQIRRSFQLHPIRSENPKKMMWSNFQGWFVVLYPFTRCLSLQPKWTSLQTYRFFGLPELSFPCVTPYEAGFQTSPSCVHQYIEIGNRNIYGSATTALLFLIFLLHSINTVKSGY